VLNIQEVLNSLPKTDHKVIVSHSGGLDSSTSLILASRVYGSENVLSVSFNYGQKQSLELERAAALCKKLNIKHNIISIPQLGDIVRGTSANIKGSDISVPSIKEVLGDPQPKTYIPHRNMILFSFVAAFAEANDAEYVICGLQATDEYGYWDTTVTFAERMNSVFALNRKTPIKLIAPFNILTKTEELQILEYIDMLHLTKHTLSCYNPDELGRSCGICPTCAERVKSWMNLGKADTIEYSINIPW